MQAAGWAKVAEAVHAEGGTALMQLMNAGRVTHPEITGTDRIVAPSAIAIDGETRLARQLEGRVRHAPRPRDCRTRHRARRVSRRRPTGSGCGNRRRRAALTQRLPVARVPLPASNQRTDRCGGSPEARARFFIEVAQAVASEVGAGCVGIRISPAHNIQDVWEKDDAETRAAYETLVSGLAPLGLAYLSVLHADPAGDLIQDLRRTSGGTFIVNSGFSAVTTRDEAVSAVDDGIADLVDVCRPAIANSDLVERWERGRPRATRSRRALFTRRGELKPHRRQLYEESYCR